MGNCISIKKATHSNKISPEISELTAMAAINSTPLPPNNPYVFYRSSEDDTPTDTEQMTTYKTNLPRVKRVSYIELNANGLPEFEYKRLTNDYKTLIDNLFSFPNTSNPIDLLSLSGLYAYCIVQTDCEKQYLLLNPLKNYESNHGLFNMWIKKLPVKGKITAAGEITISNCEVISWNLKSDGYSKGTGFDESHNDFVKNRALIWLHQTSYQSISSTQKHPYATFFSSTGSFLSQSPTSLEKLLENPLMSVAEEHKNTDLAASATTPRP